MQQTAKGGRVVYQQNAVVAPAVGAVGLRRREPGHALRLRPHAAQPPPMAASRQSNATQKAQADSSMNSPAARLLTVALLILALATHAAGHQVGQRGLAGRRSTSSPQHPSTEERPTARPSPCGRQVYEGTHVGGEMALKHSPGAVTPRLGVRQHRVVVKAPSRQVRV